MPIYEFHCRKCHHDFEQFMSMTSKDVPPCPKCKAHKTMKLVSRTIAHTPTAFALPGEQERPPPKDQRGKCTRCAEQA